MTQKALETVDLKTLVDGILSTINDRFNIELTLDGIPLSTLLPMFNIIKESIEKHLGEHVG